MYLIAMSMWNDHVKFWQIMDWTIIWFYLKNLEDNIWIFDSIDIQFRYWHSLKFWFQKSSIIAEKFLYFKI